jgi:hypothetical protein
LKPKEIYFSFIICTFRRNTFLDQCLNAIHSSIKIYLAAHDYIDFEVVVSDDDPDNNQFNLDFWNKNFSAIQVALVYSKSATQNGDYFNRNRGVHIASGKWIKFIDDDDIIYPWSLSFILNSIVSYPEANTLIFYPRDNFLHLEFPIILSFEDALSFHYFKYGFFHCSLLPIVFKKNLFLEAGTFNFKRFYGDFQILHNISRFGNIYIFPCQIGWYRIHNEQESIFNRKNNQVRFNYLLFSINYFLENNKIERRYIRLFIIYCFSYFKLALKSSNFKLLFLTIYVLVFLICLFFYKNASKLSFFKWKNIYETQMLLFDNSFLSRKCES